MAGVVNGTGERAGNAAHENEGEGDLWVRGFRHRLLTLGLIWNSKPCEARNVIIVRMQLAWYPLSPSGRGSFFTPGGAFTVDQVEARRCTGPASDILLRLRSILVAVPSAQTPAGLASFSIRPGARDALEFRWLAGRPASVFRLSIDFQQPQPAGRLT